VGKGIPRLIQINIVRKMKPMNNLITFSDNDPILRLARSNARAVTVQNIATRSDANSPKYSSMVYYLAGNLTLSYKRLKIILVSRNLSDA